MNRRGFFAASAGTLVGGRKIAEQFVENAAEAPTPIGRQGWVDYPNNPGPYVAPPDLDSPETWIKALADKALRGEIESMLYEQNRYILVKELPPDIAVLRSFSTMAKITFYRQNLVALGLKRRQQKSLPSRLADRMYGWFGYKGF